MSVAPKAPAKKAPAKAPAKKAAAKAPAKKAPAKAPAKAAVLVKDHQAKYRILVRIKAAKAQWKVATKGNTDLFTKGDTKVAIHHSNHIAVGVEMVKGDTHTVAKPKGKWFQAQEWLTGDTQPFKSQLALLGDLKVGDSPLTTV